MVIYVQKKSQKTVLDFSDFGLKKGGSGSKKRRHQISVILYLKKFYILCNQIRGNLDQIRVNWIGNCFLKILNIVDTGSNKGESGLNFGLLVQLQTEYHEPSLKLSNIVLQHLKPSTSLHPTSITDK